MRAQIHLDLAQLYWARGNFDLQRSALARQNDLEETANHVRQALEYFTRDDALTEYQQATHLQRDVKAKAKQGTTLAANPIASDHDRTESSDAITSADL